MRKTNKSEQLIMKIQNQAYTEKQLASTQDYDEKIQFLTESLYQLVESGKALNHLHHKIEKEFNELFLGKSEKKH